MENTSKSGISVITLLTLIFVVLKLTHFIGWSWWWVLSPLWISAAIVVFAVIVVVFVKIFKSRKGQTK